MDKFINPSKPAEIEIEKVEEEPLVVSDLITVISHTSQCEHEWSSRGLHITSQICPLSPELTPELAAKIVT